MAKYEDIDIEISQKLFRKEKVAIFDIDNTLIDVTERYKKSIEEAGIDPTISLYKYSYEKRMNFWKIFLSGRYLHMDKPDEESIELLKKKYGEGYGIVLLTGRPMQMEKITEEQLKEFEIPYDLIIMRPLNNREPDKIFKPRIISKLLEKGLKIIEYHEDDPATLSYVKTNYKDIKVYPHNIAERKLIFHTDKD